MTYVVFGLSFVLVISFFLGRIENNRIQKRFWRALTRALKPHCTSFKHVSFGSSGFKLVCPTRKKETLKKFEATLMLLDRENVLHYPIQVLRGGYDKLIFRANFPKPSKVKTEIISKTEWKSVSKLSKTMATWEEIKVENRDFDEAFQAYTTSARQAKKLLTDKDFLQRIQTLRESVRRMSIAPNEPHVYLVCVADEKVVPQVVDFMFTCDTFLRILE